MTSLREFSEEKPVEYFNVFNTWVFVEPTVSGLVVCGLQHEFLGQKCVQVIILTKKISKLSTHHKGAKTETLGSVVHCLV